MTDLSQDYTVNIFQSIHALLCSQNPPPIYNSISWLQKIFHQEKKKYGQTEENIDNKLDYKLTATTQHTESCSG